TRKTLGVCGPDYGDVRVAQPGITLLHNERRGLGVGISVSPRSQSSYARGAFDELPTLGLEKLPAIMGRGLVGLGVCVAGAGILACFAAVGALGMLGQRCAALWPTAAQPARQLTAP